MLAHPAGNTRAARRGPRRKRQEHRAVVGWGSEVGNGPNGPRPRAEAQQVLRGERGVNSIKASKRDLLTWSTLVSRRTNNPV
eukprot:2677566-Pyramimonas_sp.AAC.1